MKKLIVISAFFVAGMVNALGITIMNKTAKNLTVTVAYNNNTATAVKTIGPNKQQDFDTGFHGIDAMKWQDPSGNAYILRHKIPGINIGPLLTIYENGQCDMRDCITCKTLRKDAAKL